MQADLLQFECFELDARLRELRRDGRRVDLQPKPMALLRYLIEHRDRVVSKRELLREVWLGVVVSDDALQTAVRDLRRALGQKGRRPGLIQTVYGDGYRFTGDVKRAGADARPASVGLDPCRPILVERERELSLLQRALEAARQGSGRSCVLLGEPGIGKTRIACELAEAAEHRSMQVHWARCSSASTNLAFSPWVYALRACVRAAPESRRETWLRQAGAALQPFVSDLAEPLPHALAGMNPTQARLAAANSFVQLFIAAARVAPQLIILDDLHWADPDSLVALDLLAQSLADVPLLLVVLLRPGEPRSVELQRALDAIARAPSSEQIALRELSELGVHRLLTSVASSAPPPSLVATVHRWTAGNPLFVTALLPLHARGELSAAAAGLASLPVPSSLRDVIDLRVSARSAPCRRLVQCASVLGDSFSLELLARTVDLSRDAAFDALSEAESLGLLRELANLPGVYAFPHSLWREALYSSLSRVDARRVHRRAAEALEQLVESDPLPHLMDLAHHFLEALPVGEAARATRYASRAVRGALELHSYPAAMQLAARALQTLEVQPGIDPHDHAELYAAYAYALSVVASDGSIGAVDGEIDRAVQAATRLARQTEDMDLLVRVICLGSDLVLGRISFLPFSATDPARLRDLEETLALLREAHAASTGHESRARVKVLLSLSSVYWQLQNGASAQTLLEEAERLTHRIGDIQSLLNVTLVHTRCSGPDAIQASLRRTEELLRAGEERHAPAAVGLAHLLRIPILGSLGRLAETKASVAAAEQSSRQLFGHSHPILAVIRVMLDLLAGRFEQAETQILELQALSGRIPFGQLVGFAVTFQRVWLRLWQGRTAEVLPALQALGHALPDTPLVHLVLARCFLDLERAGDAQSALERALRSGALEVPPDAEWLFVHAVAAEAVHLLGDRSRAALLYPKLSPYRDRFCFAGGAVVPIGSVARALGLLAATQGSSDLALEHLETAQRQHESMEAAPLLAATQLDIARVLAGRGARGDRERRRQLLRAAFDTARKLGMLRLAAVAEAELHAISG
jgi:DNA-binding winged helix-turn-helix (wHTH) protein